MKPSYQHNELVWIYNQDQNSNYEVRRACIARQALSSSGIGKPAYVLELVDDNDKSTSKGWDDCFIRCSDDIFETEAEAVQAVIKLLRSWLKAEEENVARMTQALIRQQKHRDWVKRQLTSFEAKETT